MRKRKQFNKKDLYSYGDNVKITKGYNTFEITISDFKFKKLARLLKYLSKTLGDDYPKLVYANITTRIFECKLAKYDFQDIYIENGSGLKKTEFD